MDYIVNVQLRGPGGKGVGPELVNRYRNSYVATNTTFRAVAEVKLLDCSNFGFFKRLWCRISDPFQYMRALFKKGNTKFILKRVVAARVSKVEVTFGTMSQSAIVHVGGNVFDKKINDFAMNWVENKARNDYGFHHWIEEQFSYLGYDAANEIIKEQFKYFSQCNK
jgi:hypothetical protein